jgi:4-amino-4-deoxy-L-arabinose transferase-like glycosyltransferase
VKQVKQLNWHQGLLILALIWFIGALFDRLWLTLDNSVPAWDQADYLNGAITYWQALKSPEWFNGEWWRSFWLLSSKIPPLTYILTVPFINVFGVSVDAATGVMLLFSLMLLLAVYGLGVILFNVTVGLWAAGLSVVIPGLYVYRLEFLLDYPLTAIVSFSFYLLTFWYFTAQNSLIKNWLKVIVFGLVLGLGFLIKQTVVFFLFLPLLWTTINLLFRYQWLRLSQLLLGLLFSLLVFFPWYRTNWLLMLTAGKRATIDSALIEGDPSLTSLDAWTYYAKVLPYFLSWPLLLVPLVGFLLSWFYWRKPINNIFDNSSSLAKEKIETINSKKLNINISESRWLWLGVFLIGGYLLSSFNVNKDTRYVLPLYPVLSLVLAVGLLSWRGRWQNHVPLSTIAVSICLMLFNLFPVGGTLIANILSPKMQHHPYMGPSWHHQDVIQEILQKSPDLTTTLGVLPSTPELNQHTFSFYGGQFKRQVVGRQVGVREKEIKQDARSLDWFIIKTGDQGSVPAVQAKIVQQVKTGGDFNLEKTWPLPDQSTLKLYHRQPPLMEVKLLSEPRSQVKLDEIIIPDSVPPGYPIPVTYKWSGSWQQLKSGLLLLTWEKVSDPIDKTQNKWLHDHAIAMGALQSETSKNEQENRGFQVVERTAMLPDANLELGIYTLKATYLNRQTGETYTVSHPPITIKLDVSVSAKAAPELDLVTQLRMATRKIGDGIKGLEPIFKLTNRINQYDATQDYVKQADQTLSYRIKQEKNINWIYTLTISKVLQQDVKGSIKFLKQAIELQPNNPYHYAYLAFIYLYDWQPYQAQPFLNQALKLAPSVPEFHTLNGVAALMKGNLVKAWQTLVNH